MSGQYPSGYNSPMGGHRNQFNAPQQPPQIMNTISHMSTSGGIGQNTLIGGTVGPQGSAGSGMMSMGGYHTQQQVPSNMGAGITPGIVNSGTNAQQQHNQMVQSSGPGGSGMLNVGAPAIASTSSNLIAQQQMITGMNVPQSSQQGQTISNTNPSQSNVQGTATGSNTLAIPQPNPHKEINIVALSRLGQETVQDITSRFQEIFTALKVIQPTANRDNNTEKKVQEYFRTIRLLFKRVRIIYEKCNDGYPQGMEYTHVESLIPYKEEHDHRNEASQCEEYRKALQENQELIETVKLKNRQIREIIDRTRIIIWEINTMLAMRRS